MNPETQRIEIAKACGWYDLRRDLNDPELLMGVFCFGAVGPEEFEVPDYLNDLNAMNEAEEVLNEEQYSKLFSSNPRDHADMRYIAELAKVCGIETREELIINVDEKDKDKLNFRPGPYPTPIELPSSAIVLGHIIPAYGHELCLIKATAAQRAEAFLKAINKWDDTK